MKNKKQEICLDCNDSFESNSNDSCRQHELNRREFLNKMGKAAVVLSALSFVSKVALVYARSSEEPAEVMVRRLYESLSQEQKKSLLLPWSDARRLHVNNNWHVVPEKIRNAYSNEQKKIIREILKGVTSEEGYDKTMKAMQDDSGGLENYSACLFSDGQDKLSFLLTGRHQTLRADGGAEKNAVFGGPIFYGHAVQFNERPDHPGNVWWHQSRLASKVYHALDGNQQQIALVLSGSPADRPSTVNLKGIKGKFAGIPVSELANDQKELVAQVLRSLLEPYRKSDVEEVLTAINANGGLDKLHISFYKDGDLPDKDGIWDRWKLEGPAFVWYFRGSPHVHTWINIAHKAESLA